MRWIKGGLDAIELMEVLALLEVVGRCLEGKEDILANPNVLEDALVEEHDVDALDARLECVHCLPGADVLNELIVYVDPVDDDDDVLVDLALLDDVDLSAVDIHLVDPVLLLILDSDCVADDVSHDVDLVDLEVMDHDE